MIVTARPKALNGVEEEDDDKVDEMREEKQIIHATDSPGTPTLSRTLSARERRRDEVKVSQSFWFCFFKESNVLILIYLIFR